MTYEEAGYIIGNIPEPTDNKSYSIEDYQLAKALAVIALWDKSELVKQEENDERKANIMTTDEAIDIIQTIKDVGYFTNEGNEAFDKAIEALKKETMCNEILNESHGHWINYTYNHMYMKRCSNCGYETNIYKTQSYNYCSNCGAKMSMEWED